jgi:hypothetical protein
MKYTPPFNSIDPNASYVDANSGTGAQGSIIPASALEPPQREIIAVIQAAGLNPDGTNNAQLLAAIRALAAAGIKARRTITTSTLQTLTAIDYRLWFARSIAPAATTMQVATNPALTDGQEWILEDIQGNFQQYPLTFQAPAGHTIVNGETIAGVSSFILNTNLMSALISYGAAGNLWKVVPLA